MTAGVPLLEIHREIHALLRGDAPAPRPELDPRGVDSAGDRASDLATVQQDGRIRRWAAITEMDGRYLRVILLPDGETVHNAFFDRSFKP